MKRLPHARGGVSDSIQVEINAAKSSPRPWGCFPFSFGWWAVVGVFPTPVGVFLTGISDILRGASLPHARGGVSATQAAVRAGYRSSPRPWGCFCDILKLKEITDVFPTPVGVFPPSSSSYPYFTGLPHARGGVSSFLCILSVFCVSSPRPWGCFSMAHRLL